MANSLFQQYGQQNQNNALIQRLNQFKQTFSGDPRQAVQNLINSGRISQAQVNRMAQQADQIYKALGGTKRF
jgi:hypothetical protein